MYKETFFYSSCGTLYNISTCDFADILPHQLDATVKEVKSAVSKWWRRYAKGTRNVYKWRSLAQSYVLQVVLITIIQF